MCECSLVILKDSFSGDYGCDSSSNVKSFLTFAFDFARCVMFSSVLCISESCGRVAIDKYYFLTTMSLHMEKNQEEGESWCYSMQFTFRLRKGITSAREIC